MFKKLFGRKDAPTNEGKSASSSKVRDIRWVKKFILELSNMEGTPSYKLSHQLTIGREVGNIVIADPSVSPRHCTFILQEDVVSVLDHGSVSGTFVNGQKIPPGRYIILEESDTILVGELEVKIYVKTESVEEGIPEGELDEELPPDIEEEEQEEESGPEEDEEDEGEEEVPAAPKTSFFQKFFKSKKAKPVKKPAPKKSSKNLSFGGNSSYATNSLVRLIAVIGDVLIAYILYIIFSPFDEFRAFVNDVPVMLGQMLDIDWGGLWAIVNEEYAFVGEMIKDLYSFISSTFQVGPFFLLFVIVRLISTLLFGVSISEAMLGVRSHGNGFWKRVGGVLRVIIGIFTGPFLIFDVPAVVSRRTFKEFMTFTHTYLSSKFFAVLGTILYIPLLLAFALLSPLLQGLELPEPIAIAAKIDRRVKVANEAGATEVIKVKEQSTFLDVELEYDSQNVSLIPFFKFSGQKKKLHVKPGLTVYQKDLQRPVQLEILKTFDLKELLGIGIKNNFFLYEKFPEIYKFVYSSEAANPAFKVANDEKANRKFADEVLSFTRIAFELSADNAMEYMESYTLFLKSLMDYRSSFLALIEYKEFDQIDFFKLGNANFLRISYNRQKPFDLIIPLIKGEGKVFRVEFDKKENLGALSTKFYKFSFDGANWFPAPGSSAEEVMKPLEVLDFFAKLDLKDKINPSRAQALYAFYFERSSEVLKKDDPVEIEIWKKSLASIFTIMEKMKESIPKPTEAVAPVEAPVDPTALTTASPESAPAEVTPVEPVPAESAPTEAIPAEAPAVDPPALETPVVEEDPRLKLFQNFQDLKDAVDNRNKEFFGIQESVNI